MPAALFPPVGSPSLHVDSPLRACDQPRTLAVDEESLPPGVRCVGAPATTLTVATFAVAVVPEELVFRHLRPSCKVCRIAYKVFTRCALKKSSAARIRC